MSNYHFLYDVVEETKIRYVSFIGNEGRFDLAFITTDHYFGKSVVLDIQKGKFAILGQDDLDEPGYLEETFGLREAEAEELRNFLNEII